MGSKFGKIRPGSANLATCTLERLKKSPKAYNGRNVVSTLVLSFLQVTRTTIKARMCLNFCQVPLPTTEYAALERLNVVSTLAPSFLIGSYSFLLVTRTAIKAYMDLKFGKNLDPGLRS